MAPSDITMVLTSCKRHDLLKTTLDSFCEMTDIIPVECVIVEDSDVPRPKWLIDQNYPRLGHIKWMQNDPWLGQIASIDKAYAQVGTHYVFHCEDDWDFLRSGGWMQRSKNLLGEYPKVSMVALSGMFAIKVPRFPFTIAKPWYNECWNGISFNPGLRRMYDYQSLGGSYKRIGHEIHISVAHLKLGYVIADLAEEFGGDIVRHSGNDRRCNADET